MYQLIDRHGKPWSHPEPTATAMLCKIPVNLRAIMIKLGFRVVLLSA